MAQIQVSASSPSPPSLPVDQFLLHFSKKEVCELCNYRYSFQPIYKEDMPKALPISEIAEGIWWSLVGMVKTWLLYTLVLVSWLGIVPITAARIYHTVFYSPFHDLFLVPFRLFHTDHLIADIGKVCRPLNRASPMRVHSGKSAHRPLCLRIHFPALAARADCAGRSSRFP